MKVRVTTPGDCDALMPFEQYANLVARLPRYDEWSSEQPTV
jgi:hypothetical protein